MGREVRRVCRGWKHPKNKRGKYIPLFDGTDFTKKCNDWDEEGKMWERGLRKDFTSGLYMEKEDKYKDMSFARWDGSKPRKKDYMPEWEEEQKTHLQMYETCSEGTPISPVMRTPEELARWLVDNEASANGYQTASYDAWLRVCKGGFAPSAIMAGNIILNGVEAMKYT